MIRGIALEEACGLQIHVVLAIVGASLFWGCLTVLELDLVYCLHGSVLCFG